MSTTTRLIMLQFNEVNFDLVMHYVRAGKLPTFERFFAEHGLAHTLSETEHANCNPWIQWPTVHTGLEFAEHGVFRTGDMADTEHEQIYERLERQGHTVAALSPFNCRNELERPDYFVPDPWIRTPFAGPTTVRWLYEALGQVADDYANERIALGSYARLIGGGLPHLQWKHLPYYLWAAGTYFAGRARWRRALVCDRLLADTFITRWRKARPDYASVFLNAAAHLQHHYLFNSDTYDGPHANPDQYAQSDKDPTLEGYQLIDGILADVLARCPGARVLVASGLRQVPHERWSAYYRLDDHAALLDGLGVAYDDIHPLMTEDFVLRYASDDAARMAQRQLEAVRSKPEDVFYLDNADVEVRRPDLSPQPFYVDNRGRDLYVQLKPTGRDIPAGLSFTLGDKTVQQVDQMVSFVQYKNGHHEGLGYFADSGVAAGDLPAEFRLADLFDYVDAVVNGRTPRVLKPGYSAAA